MFRMRGILILKINLEPIVSFLKQCVSRTLLHIVTSCRSEWFVGLANIVQAGQLGVCYTWPLS